MFSHPLLEHLTLASNPLHIFHGLQTLCAISHVLHTPLRRYEFVENMVAKGVQDAVAIEKLVEQTGLELKVKEELMSLSEMDIDTIRQEHVRVWNQVCLSYYGKTCRYFHSHPYENRFFFPASLYFTSFFISLFAYCILHIAQEILTY